MVWSSVPQSGTHTLPPFIVMLFGGGGGGRHKKASELILILRGHIKLQAYV
jgi:hypothetical protein